MRISAAILLLLVVGCGSSASPTTPTPTTLTGTVTDAAGDAQPRPGAAVTPDLVGATVEVAGGNLTLTVTLAPGTLSQTQTLIDVALDTDENPATGSPGIDSGASDAALIGTDYAINMVAPRNSTQALVLRAIGNNYQFATVGTAATSFPSADQVRVIVPMSLLGDDDGRMKFKVVCSQYLTDTTVTGITDFMPDLGQSPGVVR